MARRTRLFQATGSPLIQGASRSHRPVWQPWVQALIVCVAWFVLRVWLAGPVWPVPGWFTVAVLAAGIGALAGAGIAGSWGARRRVLPGVIAGVLLGEIAGLIARAAGG